MEVNMGATYQTPMSSPAVAESARDAQAELTQQLIDRARELAPLIREHSEEAERERRLAKPVQDALIAAGFQRLLTPRSLGGLEVDPVTCARVVEEVASVDSAAGWALQAPNVNVWWASRLSDQGAEEFYGSNPSVLMAAAFHPPQQAIETTGGYRVTGRSPLASGIHDSEWVLFSAFVMDGNKPRMTEHGPVMIAFILPASDVEIIDTWYTLGMRGTDSNDGAFNDVFVPTHRTFFLDPSLEPGRHFRGPLYRFPAGSIIALFSAAVQLATARNAITEFRGLAGRKTQFGSMKPLRERGVAQTALAEAEGMLRSARAFFYEVMNEAWARTAAGVPNTLEHRADLMLAGINTARSAATVTDVIHRMAGTSGIYTKSKLERYFRDAHTLRHHGFVSESKLETVGQIYLGLPPEFPLILF
jgi:alkylation response protein AidB-like acyl-CoA dehydrogenase